MKILITGATSGIGFDLAKNLANKNHTVYITTHTEKQKETVKKKIKTEKLNISVASIQASIELAESLK